MSSTLVATALLFGCSSVNCDPVRDRVLGAETDDLSELIGEDSEFLGDCDALCNYEDQSLDYTCTVVGHEPTDGGAGGAGGGTGASWEVFVKCEAERLDCTDDI